MVWFKKKEKEIVEEKIEESIAIYSITFFLERSMKSISWGNFTQKHIEKLCDMIFESLKANGKMIRIEGKYKIPSFFYKHDIIRIEFRQEDSIFPKQLEREENVPIITSVN